MRASEREIYSIIICVCFFSFIKLYNIHISSCNEGSIRQVKIATSSAEKSSYWMLQIISFFFFFFYIYILI